MKLNNKGFTLIELIMVIVILGILAAVVVPKFFDFTTKAHTANKEAVLGNIRTAVNLYAANELIQGRSRTFPPPDSIETDGDFSRILDEEPENWSVVTNATTDKVDFKYDGDGTTYTYSTTNSHKKYSLQ